ncbi:MAG TPA: hypothetical protein VGA78_12485 [Gemmatimonadales bacterium]
MRALLLALQVLGVSQAMAQETAFSRLVARFSEAGGFFDSDNLVSNETSYLHVLGAFDSLGVRGGAYVGVGPEQSFSYIARIKPEIAFLVDIRRDNLLLHLLFKAMFERSRNRMEFLGLLYGRRAPDDLAMWTDLPLGDLLVRLDETPYDSMLHGRQHTQLMARVTEYGVPLTEEDRQTLRRFHDEFASMGLDIRFSSRGRPYRFNYPTARQLYLQTDLEGHAGSYLASEDGFRVVRELERRDRVIPVVGDLAGPSAIKSIGEYLVETARKVSVYYVSNVEMYLFRQGGFPRFVENTRALPAGSNSVMVRSYFGRGGMHSQAVPGHLSVQLLQTFRSFLETTAQPDSLTYWDFVNLGHIDLRSPSRPAAALVPQRPN